MNIVYLITQLQLSHEACTLITKEPISDITVKSILNPKSNIFTPKCHNTLIAKAVESKIGKCDYDHVIRHSDSNVYANHYFNCLSHDLLIAKLHAYGFWKISLKLIIHVIEFNAQKLMTNLAPVAKLFMVFLRDLYWDPYYSTSILMTYC